mmetsp:Transcript_42174/g.76427  ORF Transcript_42174/g.76427 Transcript_42174/m.76427 type:complete len:163 (-) Transcript_42174:56-544(-)
MGSLFGEAAGVRLLDGDWEHRGLAVVDKAFVEFRALLEQGADGEEHAASWREPPALQVPTLGEPKLRGHPNGDLKVLSGGCLCGCGVTGEVDRDCFCSCAVRRADLGVRRASPCGASARGVWCGCTSQECCILAAARFLMPLLVTSSCPGGVRLTKAAIPVS